MSAAINKFLRLLEGEMKMDELVQGFMVDLDVDSKNGSVAGHSIDMCLRLVAPEYNAKPWNKNKQFMQFLEERGAHAVLFSFKDSRFGCLSRAAAVLLYHWEHLKEFLALNPSINNRLACLVREVMELPYLQPVLAVIACLGVQLVEPFYANTISTTSTQSSLKKFFISLYKSMEDTLGDDFFSFANPVFRGVERELFEAVKVSYKEEVLSVVTKVAIAHKEEVLRLGEGMLPHIRTVLARQRRDYRIDEERFPAQYPVESQAANIDQTPVHNLAAERACGKIDYRIKRTHSLAPVSRQMILQRYFHQNLHCHRYHLHHNHCYHNHRCKELRNGTTTSFRGYKEAADKKRELELFWTRSMKERMRNGSDEKREEALVQERKKIVSLQKLKEQGGPFISADEVDAYLSDLDETNMKEKQKRMKLEISYARDTSTLLPKVDPLFKIRKDQKGKQRDKTAKEFGEALAVLLGRKADRKAMDYSTFKECLIKMLA